MHEQNAPKMIKLMVTIVDRGTGARVVDLYRAEHLHFNYLCLGFGTANSRILDYFGLSESEKDIVLTMVPAFKLPELMRKSAERFRLIHAGKGIIFTLPLSGISGHVPQVLCKPEYIEESEVRTMHIDAQHDLIVTILDRDHRDAVMDAARAAGAKGGTVLHARRVGYEDLENIWGFTIQPEKEIIAILAPRAQKHAIMQAINRSAGIATESHGLLLSLPVEDMIGLYVPQEADSLPADL